MTLQTFKTEVVRQSVLAASRDQGGGHHFSADTMCTLHKPIWFAFGKTVWSARVRLLHNIPVNVVCQRGVTVRTVFAYLLACIQLLCREFCLHCLVTMFVPPPAVSSRVSPFAVLVVLQAGPQQKMVSGRKIQLRSQGHHCVYNGANRCFPNMELYSIVRCCLHPHGGDCVNYYSGWLSLIDFVSLRFC